KPVLTSASAGSPSRFQVRQQLIDSVVALEQIEALFDILSSELRSGHADSFAVMDLTPHALERRGMLIGAHGLPGLGRLAHSARAPMLGDEQIAFRTRLVQLVLELAVSVAKRFHLCLLIGELLVES